MTWHCYYKLLFIFTGGGEGFEKFTIINDPNGINCQLTTTATLDHETQAFYELYVVASESLDQPPPVNVYDQKNATQMLVFVIVGDLNDCPPVFTQDEYYGGVSSDSQYNSVIYNLTV